MEAGFFNSKQNRVLGSLTLLMVLVALGSYAILNFSKIEFLNPMPATISVNGEGEVLAVPDIGQFSFSVTAEGKDASAAQEASGNKINAILAYLRDQGVEEKDIKTQNYNLYPHWHYEERVCPFGSYCPGGERVQDGFEVSQTVTVKLRDTESAGRIIAGVGEQGATNISSLNFTIDDVSSIRSESQEKAIEDARRKAEVLAKQLGVRVVRLVSYYEENGNYYEPYARSAMMMDSAEEKGFGGAETPVGEESIKVRVNVTYEVR